MRLLLDTNVLLWASGFTDRLDRETRRFLESSENEVLFSAISILEIAVKSRLGRPDFEAQPLQVLDAALAMGFAELPVRPEAAARVAELPLLHRDPFDHMLIAQAIGEPALFYTANTRLPPYSELVRLIRPR